MSNNLRYFSAALLVCAAAPALSKKQPELTPMQLQSIQQKEFETDKTTLFASVMSILQDLGYTIDTAEMSTGFITATSATKNKTGFWDAMGGVSGSGNTRVTAFIESMPSGRSRIRLNFVSTKTSSGWYGQSSKEDKPILDPAVYQRAFERIDEAVFVRTTTNAPAPTKSSEPPVAAATPVAMDPKSTTPTTAPHEPAKPTEPAIATTSATPAVLTPASAPSTADPIAVPK